MQFSTISRFEATINCGDRHSSTVLYLYIYDAQYILCCLDGVHFRTAGTNTRKIAMLSVIVLYCVIVRTTTEPWGINQKMFTRHLYFSFLTATIHNSHWSSVIFILLNKEHLTRLGLQRTKSTICTKFWSSL